MCGIIALFGLTQGTAADQRALGVRLTRRLRHRGPDWSGIYTHSDAGVFIGHERLAIVDVTSGAQPIRSRNKRWVLAVNGMIYNHEELRATLTETDFVSHSDCEVILHLLIEVFENLDSSADATEQLHAALRRVRGMFAFVLYDNVTGRYVAARDSVGIIPLYLGWANDGSVWFASEMKVLHEHCQELWQFPPGQIYDSMRQCDTAFVREGQKSVDISPKLSAFDDIATAWISHPTKSLSLTRLHDTLVESVNAHTLADVPFGVLLSGGLDSSLIASIATRILSYSPSVFGRLRSFSVGLVGSPDLIAARKVADHIGTMHTALEFSVQEGLDALSDVIYHIESFDVTSVRASTPMYLLARVVKACGIKVVLSGEGADEIFGGYLYFHRAPSAKALHDETLRKLSNLHRYDCLRANKSMSAFGVEARVPFLDRRFLDESMTIDPACKLSGSGRIEKHILRAAFDDEESSVLPHKILWRQKEQFSDGVGYEWINSLRNYASETITNEMFETASQRFPLNTPVTKEAYLYRQMFEQHFPNNAAAVRTVPSDLSIACSTATALAWDKSFALMADPSGRAVTSVHDSAYDFKAGVPL